MASAVSVFDVMGARFALAALAFLAVASDARATAPLYDPVTLNIGINCQWQQSCQRQHLKAMRSAHRYIAAKHQCNRNARRSPSRIDWVGFNDCIRNANLAPAPQRRRR